MWCWKGSLDGYDPSIAEMFIYLNLMSQVSIRQPYCRTMKTGPLVTHTLGYIKINSKIQEKRIFNYNFFL